MLFQMVFCTKYPAITTNSRKVVNALLYLSAIYILHSECHGATHLSPSRKFLLHFFLFCFHWLSYQKLSYHMQGKEMTHSLNCFDVKKFGKPPKL